MGWIRHHVVVVVGWEPAIVEAHALAVAIFGDAVSAPCAKQVNGFRTFVIGADGSKEGWAESDEGDARRGRWAAEVAGNVEWVVVSMDVDNNHAEIGGGSLGADQDG